MKEYKPGIRGYDILPPERDASGVRDTLPMQRTDGQLPDADLSAWDPRWGARRRGRAVARTLVERTAGLEILRKYTVAATAFEDSYQQLVTAQARRHTIPLVAEREILSLQAEIAKGRGELEAIVGLYADLRARRSEQRELETETHALELARRRRLTLEERIVIKRLEDRLAAKAPEPEKAPREADTDPLREFIHTETEVRRARSAAARVADAIRSAAAEAGRDLTPQEAELIDLYEGAAAAAEEQIRRGGAADF